MVTKYINYTTYKYIIHTNAVWFLIEVKNGRRSPHRRPSVCLDLC